MSSYQLVGPRKALSFDGVDDNVEVLHSTSLYLDGDFTVLVWATLERTPTTWKGIIDKGRGTINDFWSLSVGGEHRFLWGIGFTDDTVLEQRFPFITLGQWNFYAFGVEGSNMFMSLNGAPKTTISFTKTRKIATQNLTLGCRNGMTGFEKVNLDEVRIYNRALSATEILFLYNNGKGRKNPPRKGLVLDLNPNRWRGSDRVKDLSGYGNHGTIYGAKRARCDR